MSNQKCTAWDYVLMFYTYSQSCDQTISDMNSSNVYYNIDLSSVFAYIFNSPPSREVPLFKKSGKSFASHLVNSKGSDIGFKPFFTIFGMLELIDQYIHHANSLQRDMDLGMNHYKLINKIAKMSFFDFERYISTNKFAESVIRRFNYVLNGDDFTSYHKRALSLIGQNGPILGVGDILKKDFHINREYNNMFNNLFDRMKRTRVDNYRSPKDRNFHFLMDCGNMVLCKALQDLLGNNVYFVTDQSHRRYISDIYRNPVGVQLWCAAHKMEKSGLASSAMEVIEDIASTAKKFYTRLEKKHNLAQTMSLEQFMKELDMYTATEIKQFIEHKIMPGNIKNPSDIKDLWEEIGHNFQSTPINERSFMVRAEEKIEFINDYAKALVDLIPEMMEHDLIMQMSIHEDDMVKHILGKNS